VAIGGLITVLNNGSGSIKAGSQVEWVFGGASALGQHNGHARRILVQEQSKETDEKRVIGRAMNFARKGQNFDILIRQ